MTAADFLGFIHDRVERKQAVVRRLASEGFELQVEMDTPDGVLVAVYRSRAFPRAILHLVVRPERTESLYAIAPAHEPADKIARATALLKLPPTFSTTLDGLAAALIARGLANDPPSHPPPRAGEGNRPQDGGGGAS